MQLEAPALTRAALLGVQTPPWNIDVSLLRVWGVLDCSVEGHRGLVVNAWVHTGIAVAVVAKLGPYRLDSHVAEE